MLLRTILRPRTLRLATYRSIRFSSSAPLIHIQNGTFYKQYPTIEDSSNPPLFSNLNFTLPSQRPGPEKGSELQHWGIIGLSNRTDFLEILRGQHISVPPNARSYPYLLTDEVAAKDPRLRSVSNAIQYIGFSGEGSQAIGGTRGAYLSARYESYREETDWTVEQYLRGQTSLNPTEGEEKGTMQDEDLLRQVIDDLHLGDLLDMPVQNLSNGQTRRARIAKALLRKPELLLLDEPFMGLDPATAGSISGVLHRLAKNSTPRIILALRPQDNMPDWITHTMILGTDHKVLLQGPKSEIEDTLIAWTQIIRNRRRDPLNAKQRKVYDESKLNFRIGVLDKDMIRSLVVHRFNHDKRREIRAYMGGEPILEMDGVRVQYGDKVVLGDWSQIVNDEEKQGLHWRVRRGQRWAILGANGTGKTTLLSLITSDHPQAYAQPIKLFGRSRLPEPGAPGISIFELQSRIGHSSPEIHAIFPRQLTLRGALESAFAETVLSKPNLNPKIDRWISIWLQFWQSELDPNYTAAVIPEVSTESFPKIKKTHAERHVEFTPLDDIVQYADEITFGELSVAHQRIVLFLRALITRPDIVILDEAFSGLSVTQRKKCLAFLEQGMVPIGKSVLRLPAQHKYEYIGLSQDQALIMISHVPEEIPDSVRYYMRLPSDPGAGQEPLDFRCGMLQATGSLRFPETWAKAWEPPSRFKARRTWRRAAETLGVQDFAEFDWETI